MLLEIYPIISWIFTIVFLGFALLLVLRLIFNFTDPNPFGAVGRFSFSIKKSTDRFVYPAARFLAGFRVNTKYAPLLTILIAGVLTYFALGIIQNAFFVVDGLLSSITTGNVMAFIGFTLYGLLSLYVLFILIRFISMWFVFTRSTFLGFVQRVTDPVLIPLRRMIPPVGMFDISAMLLLILIGFLQTIIRNSFGI